MQHSVAKLVAGADRALRVERAQVREFSASWHGFRVVVGAEGFAGSTTSARRVSGAMGAESEMRHRGGPGRDLDAARAAYDVGDVDASRAAHEAKIHSDEHHAGCVP